MGDAALEALEKSAASLEFGAAPLARVVVETGRGQAGRGRRANYRGKASTRVALVACDAFAAETLSAAYRTPVTLDADNRLMGRTAVIFQDFEGMMNTPADKQRAWALLKKLR